MRTDLNINSGMSFGSGWYDRFFKSIPNGNITNPAKFNKTGQMLASPHWNRLALGVAAISSQPFIDLYNPKVDKDTAKASALRTTAKIIVCTSVGFTVRGLCYKLAENFAHGTPQEGSTLLTPKAILEEANKELRNNKLKLHKNALSTVTALFVMLFTNFLLDAPGTTALANKFLKMAHLENKIGGNNEKASD